MADTDSISRESVTGDAVNIDGFLFSDKHAIEVAKKEQSAVAYLKSQVDFKRPEAVLSVYQKLVHQKVFHTVIGLSFLKDLQDKLLAERHVPNTLVDPIDADPMVIKTAEENEEAPSKGKKKAPLSAKQAKYREKYIAAIVVCVILLITVAVMFVLALTSNSPNILNYRTEIENEYATWQQELDKREKEVTKRENELLQEQDAGGTYNNESESDMTVQDGTSGDTTGNQSGWSDYENNTDVEGNEDLQNGADQGVYEDGDYTDDGSDTYR